MIAKLNTYFYPLVLALFVFVLAFSFLLSYYHGEQGFGGSDFWHHFYRANGHPELFNKYVSPSSEDGYAFGFMWLSTPFGFQANLFYAFTAFLVFVFVPIVLYKLFKSPLVLLYFAFSVPWDFNLLGNFPQMLVGAWLVAFILKRNPVFRAASVVLVGFLHSSGQPLFLLAWVLDLLVNFVLPKASKWVLLGCAGVFNKASPFFSKDSWLVPFYSLARYFVREFNVIFLVGGVKGFFDAKRLDVLVLFVVCVVISFFWIGRVVYTLPFIGLIGLMWFLEKAQNNVKFFVLFSGIIFFLWNFSVWLINKYYAFFGGC